MSGTRNCWLRNKSIFKTGWSFPYPIILVPVIEIWCLASKAWNIELKKNRCKRTLWKILPNFIAHTQKKFDWAFPNFEIASSDLWSWKELSWHTINNKANFNQPHQKKTELSLCSPYKKYYRFPCFHELLRNMLKSLTLAANWCIFPCSLIKFNFLCSWDNVSNYIQIWNCCIFLEIWTYFYSKMSLFTSWNSWPWSCSVWYKYEDTTFLFSFHSFVIIALWKALCFR